MICNFLLLQSGTWVINIHIHQNLKEICRVYLETLGLLTDLGDVLGFNKIAAELEFLGR